jgi:hypothetical protein
MAKAISLILGFATIVQVIRPLGLPGLKTRADAWKLAAFGLMLVVLVAVTKGE